MLENYFTLKFAAKKKKYNEFAICTTSVGKTEGTQNRSEWSPSAEERYKRCKKDVKKKNNKSAQTMTEPTDTDLNQIEEEELSGVNPDLETMTDAARDVFVVQFIDGITWKVLDTTTDVEKAKIMKSKLLDPKNVRIIRG